jgi:hypothetical protein
MHLVTTLDGLDVALAVDGVLARRARPPAPRRPHLVRAPSGTAWQVAI